MEEKPLTSIIIATYNSSGDFLKQTLNSVLMQEGVNLEVVLVDDASTNDTREIIGIYEAKFAQKRIKFVKVYHEQNKGIDASYLNGVNASIGKYFKILDHDDTLTNSKSIRRSIQLLEENPSLGVVFTSVIYVNQENIQIGMKSLYQYSSGSEGLDKPDFFKTLFFRFVYPLVHGTSIVRRECFGEIPYFDFEFALRIAKSQEWGVGYVSKPSLNYRIHSQNNSGFFQTRVQIWKKWMISLSDIYTENYIKRYGSQIYRTTLEILKLPRPLLKTKVGQFVFNKLVGYSKS